MKQALALRKRRFTLAVALAATAALTVTVVAGANVALTEIAVDPFTNASSQHKTIVEPDTFSSSTTVAGAQFGRFNDGGASDIGFATSTDNGVSWSSGVLPGITPYTNPSGPYSRVSDPPVAYDKRHNVGLITSLALTDPGPKGAAVIVSRSTTGGLSWGNPVTIAAASANQDFDKNWTVCDNTTTSPFYGSCYTTWDDFGHGNLLKIAYSRDGGLTWTLGKTPRVGVIGAQPLVQPNGTFVVPLDNASETALGYTDLHERRRELRPSVHDHVDLELHRPGRDPQRAAAICRDRRCREDLRDVVGLPLPRWVRGERHRLRDLDERHDVVGRPAGPDRRGHEHGRLLHPRRRRGRDDLRSHGEGRRGVPLQSR